MFINRKFILGVLMFSGLYGGDIELMRYMPQQATAAGGEGLERPARFDGLMKRAIRDDGGMLFGIMPFASPHSESSESIA